MESLTAVTHVALSACVILVMACEERRAPAPPPPPPPAPQAAEHRPEDVSEVPEEAPAAEPEGGLSPACTKLMSCCDAWVKTTPTAKVGCDAQRHAFQAAKTPEALAALGPLCAQALEAWAPLPNIPDICK